MPVSAIDFSLDLTGNVSVNGTVGSGTLNWSASVGDADVTDATEWPGGLPYALGTGDYEIQNVLMLKRTVAAGVADNLDLSGVLTNVFGDSVTATALKIFAIQIDAPDGIKSLRFGPRGVANAAQLWFGGVTANDYETIAFRSFHENPFAGWPITAGTGDVLSVFNPGAAAVNYRILLGVE